MPPVGVRTPLTHAIIYDISDRKNPVIQKDYNIGGDYIDARMIGTNVYMVSREQVYPYYNDQFAIPVLREGTSMVVQPDVMVNSITVNSNTLLQRSRPWMHLPETKLMPRHTFSGAGIFCPYHRMRSMSVTRNITR